MTIPGGVQAVLVLIFVFTLMGVFDAQQQRRDERRPRRGRR